MSENEELQLQLQEAQEYLLTVDAEVRHRAALVTELELLISNQRSQRNDELSHSLHSIGSSQAFLTRSAYRKRADKEIGVLEARLHALIEDRDRAMQRFTQVVEEIESLSKVMRATSDVKEDVRVGQMVKIEGGTTTEDTPLYRSTRGDTSGDVDD
jgi:hypothetical protein